MNRLQKKCVFATVGVHLLLVVILFVGPAFFQPRPKTDNLQVLDVIPAHLIDAAFNRGVRNAQPPPPRPQPPAPQPQPRPVVTPPAPTPVPERVVKPEPVKPAHKTVERDLKRIEKPVKTEPHKIKVNLRRVVRNAPRNHSQARNDLRQAEALRNAIKNLKANFAPSTTVEMPGNSSAAYANYASVVKSVYEQAWVPPDNAQNDEANTKVRVTIASDGTVINARIIEPSGDPAVDASVRRTLERVQIIAPFPAGTTDKERTYIINFNLKAKRMLG